MDCCLRNELIRKKSIMIKEKIACGVVGVGYLGRHHARIYHQLDSSELVGVYETNAEAAEEICRVFMQAF